MRVVGVVGGEEDVEHLAQADDFGIEGDLNDLGVAGGAFADGLVGGVGDLAAGVTRDDGRDAAQAQEDGVEAPETT